MSIGRVDQWAKLIGKPIGKGVDELQTKSPAIVNIGASTGAEGRPIGTRAPNLSLTEDALNLVIDLTQGGGSQNIDDMLSVGDGALPGDHDVIVPLSSQLTNLRPNAYVKNDVLHFSLVGSLIEAKQTEDPDIHGKIREWLQSGSPLEEFQKYTPPQGDPFAPNCGEPPPPPPSGGSGTGTLTLSASATSPGSDVAFTFTISGGNPVEGVVFTVADQIEDVDSPGPYTLTWHVPGNLVNESLDVCAHSHGPGPENYRHCQRLSVRPTQPPTSLAVTSPTAAFNQVGEGYQLLVKATYPDGSQLDVTAGRTTYEEDGIGTPGSVVSVGANGYVEARGEGTETVRVTHEGLVVDVPITVAMTNHAPDITPLQDVTMLYGEVRVIPLSATDPDLDGIQLVGLNQPGFATIVDRGAGAGDLELRPTIADVGVHKFTVAAFDDGNPEMGDGSPITVTVKTCGNNVTDAGEACDGTDLGGRTCESIGCGNGTLACSSDCQSLNTAGCVCPEPPDPPFEPPCPQGGLVGIVPCDPQIAP